MKQKSIKLAFIIAGIAMIVWGSVSLAVYNTPNMREKDWYPDIPFQKGMSFTTWEAYGYNSSEARSDLDDMKDAGVEWVAFNIWWFQDYLNSTDIHEGAWSDTYANITDSFLYARSIGLHVLFKPMLNLEKVYDWRSFIEFSPDWMDNYTAWMVDNAIAAQNGGAEMLSIGCEMGNMQVHEDAVREMITEIRAVYDGLLTYSANHDSFWHIEWWDAVDMIGVSMYSAMTTEFDPTLQELKNVWNGYYYRLENLAAQWNKSICFTETGAQALDGSNMVPNDNKISIEQDIEELRDIYLSLFESRIWTAPWFKGTYWWIWDNYEPDPMHPENDVGFSPAIPLILETITDTYTSERIPLTSDILLRSLLPLCIGFACFTVLIVKSESVFNFRKHRDNYEDSQEEVEHIEKTPKMMVKNDLILGLSAGTLLYFTSTNLILNVFSVLASSFSFAVILGISPVSMILTFSAILIGALILGGLMLKISAKYTYLIIFLLVLGYPYITISNSTDLLFLKTSLEVFVLFLSLSGFLNNIHNDEIKRKLPVIMNSLVVFAVLLGFTLIFGITAAGFSIITITALLYLLRNDRKTVVAENTKNTKNSWKQENFLIILAKTLGISIIALVIGILIPIGNADYNLMSMNVLPLLLTIFPATIGGLILFLIYWLVMKKKEAAGQLSSLILKLFKTKNLCYSILIICGIGAIFQTLASPAFIWAFISGVLMVQFIGYLITEIKKLRTGLKTIWAYIIAVFVFIFYVLGVILNSIKGLIIYALTFLELKDGAFVTRTDFTEMPQFNIPLVVKLALLLICTLLISVVLLTRFLNKIIKEKNKSERLDLVDMMITFNFDSNFSDDPSLPDTFNGKVDESFDSVVLEYIRVSFPGVKIRTIDDLKISTFSADLPIDRNDYEKNCEEIEKKYGNSFFLRCNT